MRASCTSSIPTGSGTTTGGAYRPPLLPLPSPEFTLMPPQTHHPPRMARPSVCIPLLFPHSRCFSEYSRSRLPSLITSSTNGFDGSLMNSLQSMKRWQTFFGTPEGPTLGLLNAIQVSSSPIPFTCPILFPLEEHWFPRRLPLRALPLGWHRSSAYHLDRCSLHDRRFRPPDCLHQH